MRSSRVSQASSTTANPTSASQKEGELFSRAFRLLSKECPSWPMRYQEFCALAASYMAPLYNTARRITGDPHEAEDLVQDT